MKSDEDVIDPYRPPEMDLARPSPSAPKRAELTLKIVAIVFIILSFMAIAGGASATVGVMNPGLFMPKVGKSGDDDIDQAQEMWRDGAIRIQSKYAPFIGLAGLAGLIAGGLGVTGAIFALRTPRTKRMFLQYACLAFIAAEILGMISTLLVQSQMLAVAESITQQMNQASPQATMIISMAFRYGTIAGMVIGLLFLIVKLCFYGYSLLVVRRPATIALFADETPPNSDDLITAQIA